MKGQPEQGHDLGIGKRISTPTDPAPEWRPDGKGFEVNSKGQKRTAIPENEAASPFPPLPQIDYGFLKDPAVERVKGMHSGVNVRTVIRIKV